MPHYLYYYNYIHVCYINKNDFICVVFQNLKLSIKKNFNQSFEKQEVFFSQNYPVSINEEMMMQVVGGGKSAGMVCTISGECNSSGKSCSKTARELLDKIADLFD